MVVVGADVHERTHAFVDVVDEAGRKLGEKIVTAVSGGHAEAVMWARERFGVDVIWAIDLCRHVSRLERDLFAVGQTVVRVLPTMMAQARVSARTRGKSDWIDALAVAHGFLRESDLPVASHDELSREFELSVDRRENLVAQRTATSNPRRFRPPAHRLQQPLTALANGGRGTW